PPPPPPLPTVDPEVARVLAIWDASAGRPIDERVALWERYVSSAPPGSPYAAMVNQDLEILRAHRSRLMPASERMTQEEPPVECMEHHPLRWAPPEEQLGLDFAVEKPSEIVAAWIHFRRRGGDTFRKAELVVDGDGYLRGTVPAGEVKPPGVEYFVEVATVDGRVGTAVGTASSAARLDVD
ncbi:MAG: hypothetical protein V2A73_22085, partial [Pseudomonadota bacterium]